jgi:hypothetical protein
MCGVPGTGPYCSKRDQPPREKGPLDSQGRFVMISRHGALSSFAYRGGSRHFHAFG